MTNISRFTMGPHAIHIQAQDDDEKQWLTTLYKLMDEEVEPIINDCPIECKVLVSIEELLYTEAGPPSDMRVD